MDSIISVIFLIIVVFSVIARAKKAAEKMAKRNEAGGAGLNSFKPEMVVPPQFSASLSQLAFNRKNLDKIVAVYGVGASVGLEEVSILLNTSQEQAQNLLNQLENSGKAAKITSPSGKVRYKLI